MSEVLAQTQSEGTWLSQAFERIRAQHQGMPELLRLKEAQFQAFQQRALPSRREEAWKYNDFSFLEKQSYTEAQGLLETLDATLEATIANRAKLANVLVFVNGYYAAPLSSVEDLPEGAILEPLDLALDQHSTLMAPYLLRELDVKAYPFAALNTALFNQGLFFYLPKNARLQKPLHILSVATQATPFMMQPRHLIVMEQGSALSLTEEYIAQGATHYFNNVLTDCFVGRDAELTYYKIQNEAAEAKHLATIYFHQKQHSRVNAGSFAFGSQLMRNDVFVTLREAHAACRLSGFYGTNQNQQVLDHHLFVDHLAPHTQSEIDFRGVLAKQSRAIFNGQVKVHQVARDTVAKQYNHNILLSTQAEVYSKPDLEIYADEVQCKHGATVGQLDEEALFYLETRGLPREEARMLLLQAFMDSILGEIQEEGLAQQLKSLWALHLQGLSL